ncbi:MAG: DNA gyrase subunit A [Deltaproteobacteria bacterium]|nr:MAG: DNA gyrase subunit A [Deltaproteobacteria bacterium]
MSPLQEKDLSTVTIEEEMKRSYLEYAMSVIVGRALPDVRDGLKPVHRRVLYAMEQLKNYHDRPYKKSARVVGDVIGKYHPHGDAAVYDTVVRMAQPFSLRYPLVDGQGNFGSVDGDPPAAMRYTEIRMERIAEEFLQDVDKETVEFSPNYDGSMEEPLILPTNIPNLLISGSSGIAVGMATNIPPHNLGEVADSIIHTVEKPDISLEELMLDIPGPDFPTAGFIYGNMGVKEAYATGRGIIKIRARAFVEKIGENRERIVITEIPYQVNKANLLKSIGDLVKSKKINGITDIRDESDREGLRVAIEIKRDAEAAVILNRLYKFTQMETSFGIIMLAIVHGKPEILNLKQIIQHFINHRKEIIIRRTSFELRKAEARAHILEGLKVALDHLDRVVELIRSSRSPSQAKTRLVETFQLSDIQAQAILDMRLQRLTGLERDKINDEYKSLIKEIERFRAILTNEALVLDLIKQEMIAVKEKYGDERRTEITEDVQEIDIEDLIVDEDMVITVSHAGYIKRSPISLYRAQRRGGKGVSGTKTREQDFVSLMFVASTHDYLLFFMNTGRLYWRKVHEIPEAGRVAKGTAIVNLLDLHPDERVATILSVKGFEEGKYVVMATKKGLVKKTKLSAYSHPRATGIAALRINEGDELIGVRVTTGKQDIFLSTKQGKAIRFNEQGLRDMGRVAAGNTGIRVDGEDRVVSLEILNEGATILTITENGYGKRTDTKEYRVQQRGGKGVFSIKTSERNGPVVSAIQVTNDDELIILSGEGKIIRIRAADISVIGRHTQGVKLINLEAPEKVVSVARLVEE